METFEPRIPIAAITDEFSPSLDEALRAMKRIGITNAELRVIDGKNVVDLNPHEMAHAKNLLDAAGFQVVCIASPLLKCVLPNSGELDSRYQHDVFASSYTFADQEQLAERAFAIAGFFGAPIIRVFSYWRTVTPERCREAVIQALSALVGTAEKEDKIIGLENEHACNIATAAEAVPILDCIRHPRLKLVWDPANAFIAGEIPFPAGYSLLPKDRIAHVHAKDCHLGHDGRPVWGPLGTRHVLWREQIRALMADGYRGAISLETHWPGPLGNKLEASTICAWNLRGLAAG
ncbi:MAG: sugar phosphate isomerase/epimerase [Acidobacteriaceae bacterium]|nr:sugar phosphate isomerase/epimerase [Acidobacteriaceae bacterium]